MNSLPERQQADCGGQRLKLARSRAWPGSCAAAWHQFRFCFVGEAVQRSRLTDGHRLIAWDAPGYGGSAALAQTEPDAAAYANALAALIAELQLQQPLIVGHSLGASIGSAFAAANPDRLSGLVLADPAQGYATAPLENASRCMANASR